jgi:hypothetical protein
MFVPRALIKSTFNRSGSFPGFLLTYEAGEFGHCSVNPPPQLPYAPTTSGNYVVGMEKGAESKKTNVRLKPLVEALLLCGYLRKRKRGNTGAVSGMLDGDGADVAFLVNVEDCILIGVVEFWGQTWTDSEFTGTPASVIRSLSPDSPIYSLSVF